jgi:hypothetical protein
LISTILFIFLPFNSEGVYCNEIISQQAPTSQESQSPTPISIANQSDNNLLLTILLLIAGGLGSTAFFVSIYFYYSAQQKEPKSSKLGGVNELKDYESRRSLHSDERSIIKEEIVSEIQQSTDEQLTLPQQQLDPEVSSQKDIAKPLTKNTVEEPSKINSNPKQTLTGGQNKYPCNDAYVRQLKSRKTYYNLNWQPSSAYRHEQSRNEPIFLYAVSSGDHAFVASEHDEFDKYPTFYYLHPRNKLFINNIGFTLDIFRFFFDLDECTPIDDPTYYCDSWEPALIEFREDNLFELYRKGKLLLISEAKSVSNSKSVSNPKSISNPKLIDNVPISQTTKTDLISITNNDQPNVENKVDIVEDEQTKQLKGNILAYVKNEDDKLWKRCDDSSVRFNNLKKEYEEKTKYIEEQLNKLNMQLSVIQKIDFPMSSMKYWVDLFNKNPQEFDQLKYTKVSICNDKDKDILNNLPQGSYVYLKEDIKGYFRLIHVSNETYFLVPNPDFKLNSRTISITKKLFNILPEDNDNNTSQNISMLCCAEIRPVEGANKIWRRDKIGILECIG